jgi:hypothetical protein
MLAYDPYRTSGGQTFRAPLSRRRQGILRWSGLLLRGGQPLAPRILIANW